MRAASAARMAMITSRVPGFSPSVTSSNGRKRKSAMRANTMAPAVANRASTRNAGRNKRYTLIGDVQERGGQQSGNARIRAQGEWRSDQRARCPHSVAPPRMKTGRPPGTARSNTWCDRKSAAHRIPLGGGGGGAVGGRGLGAVGLVRRAGASDPRRQENGKPEQGGNRRFGSMRHRITSFPLLRTRIEVCHDRAVGQGAHAAKRPLRKIHASPRRPPCPPVCR